MAPTFSTLTSLLRRSTTTIISRNEAANYRLSSLGPLAARAILTARDDSPPPAVDPTRGAINPHDINNNAIFALFGLLGAAFVITGIWFFFWAKNGGFVFKENDWDEYKSTVMRRRGPNGTLLSGATPSTQLGGGSIYKDVYDDGSTEYTGAGNGDGADLTTVVSGTTGITGITGGVSDIYGREKRRKKREQKEREKERRREEKERGKSKSRRKVGVDGALIDEDAEAEAKAHLREYRHEKAARVGGINKESEGSSWDGSTNPSHSTVTGSSSGYTATETGSTVTSELIANRERTPTKKTEEKRGIRKVYSTADKNDRRENERLRAEAKRLREQEKMNARSGAGPSSGGGGRRDFSWSKTDETMALRKIDEQTEVSESVVTGSESYVGTESRVPGGWGEESDIGTSDLGTKVYRHPVHIPITSSAGGPSTPAPAAPSTVGTASEVSYAEEKRKKRGGAGYRRDRDREGRA
ncbi:hypothetical protein V8F06_009495 [Rhypophila decipiens]